MLLATAAVVVFIVAALLAASLVLGENRQSGRTTSVAVPPNASPSETTTQVATTGPPSTTSQPQIGLARTDAQGFVDYPGARCDPENPPAAIAQTTKSVLVICQVGPANYRYRAVRLSVGAGLELANAVSSSGGFDVTNPADGTRYELRPAGVTIIQPDGQMFSEQMVQYRALPTATASPVPRDDPLDVGISMSHPACDGTGIVVLGSAITPGRYQADVRRFLATFPGSSYLRTDESCSSLRQATEEGNPIYAVYRVAGRTPQEVCSAVKAAGGNAYGKWLDNVTDPAYVIPC
jgi:hypothetical protein